MKMRIHNRGVSIRRDKPRNKAQRHRSGHRQDQAIALTELDCSGVENQFRNPVDRKAQRSQKRTEMDLGTSRAQPGERRSDERLREPVVRYQRSTGSAAAPERLRENPPEQP